MNFEIAYHDLADKHQKLLVNYRDMKEKSTKLASLLAKSGGHLVKMKSGKDVDNNQITIDPYYEYPPEKLNKCFEEKLSAIQVKFQSEIQLQTSQIAYLKNNIKDLVSSGHSQRISPMNEITN